MKNVIVFVVVYFLSFALCSSLNAQDSNEFMVDFESGDFRANGIEPKAVRVTRDPKEVVYGKVSMIAESSDGQGESIYLVTPPGLFKKGVDVQVKVSYRTLEVARASYFFLRITSPQKGSRALSYTTWKGNVGTIGKTELNVKGVNLNSDDYRIEFGIHGQGSLVIDNIRVGPNLQPIDEMNPTPIAEIKTVMKTPDVSSGKNDKTNITPAPFSTISSIIKTKPIPTNCGCDDRDGWKTSLGAREHTTLTITNLYDMPLNNSFFYEADEKSIKDYLEAGPVDSDGNITSSGNRYKAIFVHLKEWFCDQDYHQYDTFFQRCDNKLWLRSPGRPDVRVAIRMINNNVNWFGASDDNIREIILQVRLEDYIRMPPGVAYVLEPRNAYKDYVWKTSPGAVFVRSPNEDIFPDPMKIQGEEVLAKALEMEQNKNYIQAMLQLGTVQKISPIYDKAQEAIKRIKAQIQKEIDDYKKTGRF
jgi:hypothetical protein